MKHVPIESLVDPSALSADGRPPSPRALRTALPAGWVLDEDGRTAHRDLRLMARQGWLLLLLMVVFATLAAGIFWSSFPRGAHGLLRLAGSIALVLLAGGLVAPIVTRALYRRR